MSPKEWKQLKIELTERGLEVQTVGRQRKEYVVATDYMLVNILRGGMLHTSQYLEVFVYNPETYDILSYESYRTIQQILKLIDSLISDYNEFGSIC